MRLTRYGVRPAAALFLALIHPVSASAVERWHPAKFSFQDHESYTEAGTPNPFVERRLVATFVAPSSGCVSRSDCDMNAYACTAGACVYKVEGFFDSDLTGGPSGPARAAAPPCAARPS